MMREDMDSLDAHSGHIDIISQFERSDVTMVREEMDSHHTNFISQFDLSDVASYWPFDNASISTADVDSSHLTLMDETQLMLSEFERFLITGKPPRDAYWEIGMDRSDYGGLFSLDDP
jgi:hypothetical protein